MNQAIIAIVAFLLFLGGVRADSRDLIISLPGGAEKTVVTRLMKDVSYVEAGELIAVLFPDAKYKSGEFETPAFSGMLTENSNFITVRKYGEVMFAQMKQPALGRHGRIYVPAASFFEKATDLGLIDAEFDGSVATVRGNPDYYADFRTEEIEEAVTGEELEPEDSRELSETTAAKKNQTDETHGLLYQELQVEKGDRFRFPNPSEPKPDKYSQFDSETNVRKVFYETGEEYEKPLAELKKIGKRSTNESESSGKSKIEPEKNYPPGYYVLPKSIYRKNIDPKIK